MKQQRRKESKKERKQEGKEWMRLTRRRWMRKKILRKENKNCTMCEGHLHISLGRAEVCATVVVCLFLLSLPASVALFLTFFCLGSLWGLLWRFAPPFLPNLSQPSHPSKCRTVANDEPSEQAGQAKHDENYMYNIIYIKCAWGWVQYTI